MAPMEIKLISSIMTMQKQLQMEY